MTVSKLSLQGEEHFYAPDVKGVHIDAVVLGVETAETYTVPDDCRFLLFSADGDFFARYDGSAATIPSTEIADGTGSEINPAMRYVARVASVSLISSVARVITICAYK